MEPGGPTPRTFRSDVGSYHVKRMVQKLCNKGTICSSKKIEVLMHRNSLETLALRHARAVDRIIRGPRGHVAGDGIM
jgi:hypothetical protein